MSVGVLQSAEFVSVLPEAKRENLQALRETSRWRPNNFARDQIRQLVGQLFFSNAVDPVRQVVFCAAESGTDVQAVCLQVAEELALDAPGSVAMVSRAVSRDPLAFANNGIEEEEKIALRDAATTPMALHSVRIRSNLWLVPHTRLIAEGGRATGLRCCLNQLRREFEYSIIQGPAAGESSEAAAFGQSADGIVLVLAAHVTRRTLAFKIKETLEAAHVRLLGTVLSERRFPIPEVVYRYL